MSHVLVTGGAGFIGSHLVEALLERGRTVRVLDNFSTGDPANLFGVRDRVEVIDGDVTDPESVRAGGARLRGRLPPGGAGVCAAERCQPVGHPSGLRRRHAASPAGGARARVRRVVYAASSSAYGGSKKLPKSETDQTLPLSPYAAAKLAGENYCAAFSEVYGLETVRASLLQRLRPAADAGQSRTPPSSPCSSRRCRPGEAPLIHGDGKQSRDFTFIADVVQANLKAADAPAVSGNVYNIACGRRTTLLELVAHLNDLLGTRIWATHGPAAAATFAIAKPTSSGPAPTSATGRRPTSATVCGGPWNGGSGRHGGA